MVSPRLSIVIVDPDDYLAGMYARKFELDGWKVQVVEQIHAVAKLVGKKYPSALLVEPDGAQDATATFIRAYKADATKAKTAIIILTTLAEKGEIDKMTAAGADAYLIKGHFVPNEVVRKIKALVHV